MALLGLEAQGRDRARLEALQADRLGRFLAIAVGALLDAAQRGDGSGYSREGKDARMPLEAHIFAVAGAVEAIRSRRLNRAALGIEAARAKLRMRHGRQCAPAAADACVGLFENGHYRIG